jgi:hypothetical protein
MCSPFACWSLGKESYASADLCVGPSTRSRFHHRSHNATCARIRVRCAGNGSIASTSSQEYASRYPLSGPAERMSECRGCQDDCGAEQKLPLDPKKLFARILYACYYASLLSDRDSFPKSNGLFPILRCPLLGIAIRSFGLGVPDQAVPVRNHSLAEGDLSWHCTSHRKSPSRTCTVWRQPLPGAIRQHEVHAASAWVSPV